MEDCKDYHAPPDSKPPRYKLRLTFPRLKATKSDDPSTKEPKWGELRALVPVPYEDYKENFYYFSGDKYTGLLSLIYAIAEDYRMPTAWYAKFPKDDPNAQLPNVYTWWIPHFFTNGLNLVGIQKGQSMYDKNLFFLTPCGDEYTKEDIAGDLDGVSHCYTREDKDGTPHRFMYEMLRRNWKNTTLQRVKLPIGRMMRQAVYNQPQAVNDAASNTDAPQ